MPQQLANLGNWHACASTGTDTPEPTFTPTPTGTQTATATEIPAETATPTPTATATEIPAETATPEETGTETPPPPTGTQTPTATAEGSGYQSSGMPAMAAPALLDYQAPMGVDPQSGIGAQPSALTERTITYTYDPLNRLTAADYDDGNFFHYAYDAVGNRLSQETLSGTNTYAYDIANRLTSVDGVAYTWDANGNLLSDGVTTYAYNYTNMLASVNQGGVVYSYSYNGMGDRLQQTADGVQTNYTLDINTGLTQVLADGTSTYLYGQGRIAQDGTTTEYFLGNALSSVRQLVDDGTVVTLSQGYEPYGNILTSVGNGESMYQFTGEAQDSAIKLVYLRSRYYSSESGRFITKDVWEGDYTTPMSYNAWLYGYGNPVKYTDPTGKFPCEICMHFHTTSQIEWCLKSCCGSKSVNTNNIGVNCSPSPYPNPCTPKFTPPDPIIPLDIDPINNPYLSASGRNVHEFLEDTMVSRPFPPYQKPYNPPNLPYILHPDRIIYSGRETLFLGLAVDVGGVLTDSVTVLGYYFPGVLPAVPELQGYVSGIELTYYLVRLEQGYDDSVIGVFQKQLDQGSLIPVVGGVTSFIGVFTTGYEIMQNVDTIPYE